MLQQRLWPLNIIEIEPVNLGTARLRARGLADDGHPYFIKTQTNGALVPAAEILCSAMAAAIGLAVPMYAVAILLDGTPAFASRAEAGLENSVAWFQTLLSSAPAPINVVRQLSAWFAFDLAVNNEDRHINNFLCREVHGVRSLFGFDFSEAFIAQSWPLSQDLRQGCNTLAARTALSAVAPIQHEAAVVVLERLEALPDDWMGQALQDVPLQWLPPEYRAGLLNWWASDRPARMQRISRDICHDRYS